MEINWSLIVGTIINFIILLAILKHYFFNKVKDVIEDRQNEIEDKIIRADEDLEKGFSELPKVHGIQE